MRTVIDKSVEPGWLNPPQESPVAPYWRSLRALGSLRFTLVALMLLGAAVISTHAIPGASTWLMVTPLALVSANLLAAIAVQPAFRSQPALLAFHLALLAIVALVALGRLTYLRGHVELAQGEAFAGQLTGYDAGPWHPWGIREVRFVNEGFTIDYLPGRQRDHTHNRIRFAEADGRRRTVVIGDQVPLALGGYRFYTSFNKGFALQFLWEPAGGAPQRGAVHLPGYPIHEYRQANTWTPPGAASALWVQLRFDEPLLDPKAPARFRTPGSHEVVVRVADRRLELQPGEGFALDGGTVRYEGIGTWMGYRVFYDLTIPWLLAACAAAAASLGWHAWRKYAGRPWWAAPPDPELGP